MELDLRKMSQINLKLICGSVVGLVAIIAFSILWNCLFLTLDASSIAVVQRPITGELAVYTEPGMKWLGFGTTTIYPRRVMYSFSSAKDQGSADDQSIRTFFNDGVYGNISGVLSWEMPDKPEQIIRLHKEYHGWKVIDQQLIRPMLENVMFGVGAAMSTTESSSERRTELPRLVNDQMKYGVYVTHAAVVNVKDPLTGQDKPTRSVQIELDASGKPVRSSDSTITQYGIKLSSVTLNDINYDPLVTKQIAERQNAVQQVQLSQAAALRATQEAITTAKQGEANAAKTKWEQEAINAKEIALAEKNRRVAELDALTAVEDKKRLILEGEGEAAKRQLIMSADGALDKKLEAYVAVNKAYAEAIQSAAPGAWTPAVQMGNGSGGASGAQAMMEMYSAKIAKDLGLEMQVGGSTKTKK